MLPRWAVLVLALLVGAIWSVSVVVGMIDPTRAASPYLHGIFGVIVGAVFGLDKVQRRGQQIEPPPPPDPATADSSGSDS